MAPLKPFLQVFPGQNDPNLRPLKGKNVDPAEWERKQRLKEYRIAARREKRNRKSDEKKQRKLNATILRRMTRNPTKYTKNAGRNRLRAIEAERRKIQHNALLMMHRIAAVYDPSGKMFNVKPVTTLEDGRVVTLESLEKKKERQAEKQREKDLKEQQERLKEEDPMVLAGESVADRLNPERMKLLIDSKMEADKRQPGQKSKTQIKKEAQWAPRDPLVKPFLPEGIDIPSDEEEDWMDLWDLPDEEVERRVAREKRRKARARKELRQKQKSGKAERRAARDEKRRVYRELKESWKILREEERRRRKFLCAMEDEEGKKLANEVTMVHRHFAVEVCAELGFTMDNVQGISEIAPKALGMKGVEVDFDKLEKIGDAAAGLKFKDEYRQEAPRGGRVNLGAIASEKNLVHMFDQAEADNRLDEVVTFDQVGEGQDHEALTLNHRVRRKLRRAMENAQIQKELLVRETAIKHCEENGIPVHPVLRTSARPINVRGARTLEDGRLETQKHERVRARVELAEFNRQAKILRKQAKETSVEAGIRIYLELIGRIPKREGLEQLVEARARAKLQDSGTGPTIKDEDDVMDVEGGEVIGGIWPAQSHAVMSAAEWFESWPIPDDPMIRYQGTSKWREVKTPKQETKSSEDEDSAARQLRADEFLDDEVHAPEETDSDESASEEDPSSDEDDDSDDDSDMS